MITLRTITLSDLDREANRLLEAGVLAKSGVMRARACHSIFQAAVKRDERLNLELRYRYDMLDPAGNGDPWLGRNYPGGAGGSIAYLCTRIVIKDRRTGAERVVKDRTHLAIPLHP